MANSVSNKQEENNSPSTDQLTKIGTVAVGEKPRTASFASYATRAAGYIASFIGAAFSQILVSDLAKEPVSAYEVTNKETILSAALKGAKQALDPKCWKSTLAGAVTSLGGVFLTNQAVKKIEQHTFKQRHGTLPQDKLDQILQENSAPAASTAAATGTDWQDKARKAEESQRSVAR